MKTLLLNPCSGLAGDMFVAALLDAGADTPDFWAQLNKLPLADHGCTVRREDVMRCGVRSARFIVDLGKKDDQHVVHDHAHDHVHDHVHHDHSQDHVHRSLADVVAIISAARLSETVTARAIAAFTALADAEAAVHGMTRDTIHFHEVGAFDAIVDMVAAMVALETLEIEQVISGPPTVGHGVVKCAHGLMPVPPPAVATLLKDVPVRTGDVARELVTPTGAALLITICTRFDAHAHGIIAATGYGAGTWDNPHQANVLQAMVLDGPAHDNDPVFAIEATIDDMAGERYSYLFPMLLEAGALDVTATPCVMKKSRPGVTLQALAPGECRDRIATILLRETSTFGVRWHACERRILQRRIEPVETAHGTVRVKLGWDVGISRYAPEYDSCRAVAESANAPFSDVYDAAIQTARAAFPNLS